MMKTSLLVAKFSRWMIFKFVKWIVKNLIIFNRLWYTGGKLKLIDLYIMRNEYRLILNLINFQSKYIKINKHY